MIGLAWGDVLEGTSMKVIGLFALFAFILDGVAVAICSVVERYSPNISLLIFLGLFMLNFVIAWMAAIRLTERYLVSDAEQKANSDHVQWVNSLFPARR
jgi:hypothetical protein